YQKQKSRCTGGSVSEKSTALELMHAIAEWLLSFNDLPGESAVRKAPLNRSTRPLPDAEIPKEYEYLVDEWITQDLLFRLLEDIKQAAECFKWNEALFPLAFQLRGLRGHELTQELLHYRKALQQISVRPWYKRLWRRLFYRKKINEDKNIKQ
ncbi:MAG TPA: hypothetical protein VMQ76_04335, partial [Terracidiphilus sp.]|nr:hypothetical protein [Terracidiphilus sp.]